MKNLNKNSKKKTLEFAEKLIKKFNSEFRTKLKMSKKVSNLTFLNFPKIKLPKELPEKPFRDAQKNRVKLLFPSMCLKADINENGVGDGQKPDIARTYTISFSLIGQIKPYRAHEHNSHQTDWLKFYGYSRNEEEIIERFINTIKHSVKICQFIF